MNPIYTGKDVSFIDTKQAQRAAENTLLGAEKFATLAALHRRAGSRRRRSTRRWRQLAVRGPPRRHHRLRVGPGLSRPRSVAGARRSSSARPSSTGRIEHLAAQIDTTGDGQAVTVFNAHVVVAIGHRPDRGRAGPTALTRARAGRRCRTERPASCVEIRPIQREAARARRDHRLPCPRRARAVGYRTFRVASQRRPRSTMRAGGRSTRSAIENETFALTVDPPRGGGIASLVDKRQRQGAGQAGRGRQRAALVSTSTPNHPLFAEGPWHLTPDWPVHVRPPASPTEVTRRGVADRPADPDRRARSTASRRVAGDPPVGRASTASS